MERLLSDRYQPRDGDPGGNDLLADDFREMGLAFTDLFHRPFSLWDLSVSDDLGLFPAEGEKAWDLSFTYHC
jgi:hypothetical protein